MDVPSGPGAWALLLLAYLLGTLPSAHLIARRRGVDPTAEGSGNPGATNVYRTAGRRAGMAVFFADAGKGAIATAVGLVIDGRSLGLACWVAATVGHVLPITRQLRGGKGVATGGGGAFVLFPLLGVLIVAVFAFVTRVTGKVSLGSIVISIALPVGVVVAGRGWAEFFVAVGVCLLVLARHQANIIRLISGKEQRWDR
ncbi:MAG: glycerol-3-phosphate 1-O-acyltransferase PlsY [Acidimicrobiales bacterium]|nr:glycerol-3-phosphate 1-O-acyltransferase PlsY [Acidimicrobiales bacterium]